MSSGAYSPASTNLSNRAMRYEWFKEMRKANRVKRGNAAEKRYRMAVHADMLKIRTNRFLKGMPEYPNKGGGIRGKITKFSPASRKRMIEFMASIRGARGMLFLTMTYDDEAYMRAIGNTKQQLEAFRKRFERKFPTWSAFWRVETKTRKSGMLKGTPVPHYHMIVFTDRNYDEKEMEIQASWFAAWGIEAWHKITASTDENHRVYGFHVTPVRSRKHAYHYVSKYLSKMDDEISSIGRRWGRIGEFDTSASQEIELDEDEIIIFRRLVRRWLRNKKRGFMKRFARMSPVVGFCVFGLSDARIDGVGHGNKSGVEQFIDEVQRQLLERNGGQEGWAS